jgi:hypothetical protein
MARSATCESSSWLAGIGFGRRFLRASTSAQRTSGAWSCDYSHHDAVSRYGIYHLEVQTSQNRDAMATEPRKSGRWPG